jgi:hypothetical protein
MAVMPRESWTDERLDDFRGEVNRRFDETNRRIDETNQRMDAGFAVMRAEFARINDRLDALYQLMFRGMIAFGVGIFGVIVAFLLQH